MSISSALVIYFGQYQAIVAAKRTEEKTRARAIYRHRLRKVEAANLG
jgi:hypothetical protein